MTSLVRGGKLRLLAVTTRNRLPQFPDVPTVSREHARFTFADGRWWITNQGRNGLTLNGAPVTGEQPLSDGDAIRWGTNPDAPLSRVEIS